MTIANRFDDLCRQFSLRPIRSEAQNDRVIEILDRLTDNPSQLTDDDQDYMEVLSLLVHEYETRHHPRARPTGVALLRALIDENELDQVDLAKQLGVGTATISEILNGKRSISPKVRGLLGKRFAIPPSSFA